MAKSRTVFASPIVTIEGETMTAAHNAPEIGLQLYTIRNLFEAHNIEQTLGEVARIGYRNVELVGLYGKEPAEIKAILDRVGLRAVSTHEPLETLESDPDGVVARARVFGYDLVAVPWLAPQFRNLESYRAIATRLTPVQQRLAQHGITLMWHNHDFEFHPLESGELPEDLLLASGVAAELDLYWICHADQRPLDMLVKYNGRTPVLHIKDMSRGEKNFTEVGRGVLNLSDYVDKASEYGVRYLMVEQDANWTVDPMESARVGFENLSKMLAGLAILNP
jgi:sugar phosphate isomerase/epimerase